MFGSTNAVQFNEAPGCLLGSIISRTGVVRFRCGHKAHLFDLVPRLVLSLSEAEEHKKRWKLRKLAENIPIWILERMEANFVLCKLSCTGQKIWAAIVLRTHTGRYLT